jgi:phosphoribosyl 1,2-cyclic phosphate phosphodiesterase
VEETIAPLGNPRTGELVFLGTGTSHGVPMIGCDCAVCTGGDPRNQRTRCSVVLGLPRGNLLIDTTPELRVQLLRERISRVHAVAYTHAHADHLFGLDDLRIFPRYLGQDMPIYCEQEVEQCIRRAFSYAFDPATRLYPAGGVPRLVFQTIEPGRPFEVLGTTLLPLRLAHGTYRVLGFRVGDVAYCTDVKEVPAESAASLADLDVLILDCLRDEPHATHMSFDEAMDAIARLRPRRTLLTHISHRLDHEATSRRLPEGVAMATDGLRIPLTGMQKG